MFISATAGLFDESNFPLAQMPVLAARSAYTRKKGSFKFSRREFLLSAIAG